MTPQLRPGQLVDILLDEEGEQPEIQAKLSSRILEVSPRGFSIFRPMIDGAPLSIGKRLRVTFVLENAIWTMDCPVQGTVSMRIDLGFPDPEHTHRAQRREHLRVGITMPVDYQIGQETKFGKTKQGVLRDLSGGGCLLLLDEEIHYGALLLLHLSLEEHGRLEVMGRVVRVSAAEKRRSARHLVAVEFSLLTDRNRDRLVKFVFNKHREEVIKLKQRVL